ncbi:MAG TPA: ATP-binding protein [Nitrososphaeraceae archaeon]|jgi:Holliday junction DNA helicase RuvB|nr:ATP-binding protein [Nitrososphaeraceae archaeon]
MSFLRQLFGITTRRGTEEQKLHRSNRKTLVTAMNYEKEEGETKDDFFEYIIGYNDIKKFLRMSISTEEPIHILLIGPPASAKTMFIKSMMMKLDNSYFTDGGNTTKAGMLDYVFENKPKYLLIDEIDKMSTKDQTFLLNLMETGMVSETKHAKTRMEVLKTWVIASSNDMSNIIPALKSRFFIIELEPYSYEQFCQITMRLLIEQHKVKEEIAKATAHMVWNRLGSKNIRDCVRIGRIAKSVEDVGFISDTLRRYGYIYGS